MAKTTAKPPASMSSVLFGGQPGAYPPPVATKPKKKAPPGKAATALARNKG